MFMVIYAGGMPFNGETIPSGESLGGSESAAYYMAREMAALGHKVTVFTTSKETGTWDGVRYEYHGEPTEAQPLGQAFHFYMQAPVDVLVIQRHPAAFLKGEAFNAKLHIFWLHDLALKRSAQVVNATLVQTDRIFAVSEWHKKQIGDTYNVEPEHIFATHNGVDYSAGEDIKMKGYDERIPNSLLYTSRPERGLENLVGKNGIMEVLPDHHLYVCGYDNTQPNMRSYYEYLWSRCEELPNVTLLGSLGKKALYEKESEVLLHVYPTTFEDTSCIVVLEAAMCGTPLLGSKWSAVTETAKGTGAKLLPLKNGQVDLVAFVKQVKHLTKKHEWERLHAKAMTKHQSWAQAAKGWEDEFAQMLAKKSTGSALVQHLHDYSDLVFLKKLADEEGTPGPATKMMAKCHWMETDSGVHEQNKKHHDYLYQNPSFPWYDPNIKNSPRFKMLAQEFLQVDKGTTVYDVGPSEGAISLALASTFPEMTFVGVDIEERNVKAYNDKAKELGLKNAECHLLLIEEKENETISSAGVVLLGEVLEHIPDFRGFLLNLYDYVEDGCKFICTTPFGLTDGAPDQSKVHVPVHVHHFERADLLELYGHLTDYNVLAVPTRMLAGIHSQGHYVYSWTKDEKEIGEISYIRKLGQQAPRQTLSLCMIVKDGGNSLGKCFEKIEPFVDEIIVGMDPATTDNTWDILKQYAKVKAFTLDEPVLESGFDVARNATLEKATADWILWLDDDESFENGHLLHKYLRQNPYNGYLVPQHHYAAFPAEKFKTDFPARMFRNGQGTQFIGVVHEHPYKGMNKDVGKAIVPNDLAIMHTGYATEDIRRRRFDRNFPLIQRDREEYPDRILGKMLWVRDMSHICRYTLERNGGQITQDILGAADEMIVLYREVLKEGGLRMALDSIVFYSHAVQLSGGGLKFAIAVDATRNGDGPTLGDDKVIQGEFQNYEDINTLVELIVKDKTDVLKERYY